MKVARRIVCNLAKWNRETVTRKGVELVPESSV